MIHPLLVPVQAELARGPSFAHAGKSPHGAQSPRESRSPTLDSRVGLTEGKRGMSNIFRPHPQDTCSLLIPYVYDYDTEG